jgi:nucleoside-diphosphate-sugar epimerase
MELNGKIVIAGGAGLVGQNLITLLRQRGYTNLISLDKHAVNNAVLRRLHPEVEVLDCDLAEDGAWQDALQGAQCLVMLQAQIGGLVRDEFVRNNESSTVRLLREAEKNQVPYMVHISSSVVNSQADDFYTQTKKAQEDLVEQSAIRHCVLRPTLMFGWFDRKHLGWLSRFMARTPVFPIPGHGRYIRQPLFVLDFCNIIIACIEGQKTGAYNISGVQRIFYIDMIRQIREACGLRTPIITIPFSLFHVLLYVYGLVSKNPPFTTQQLAALVIPEEFEIVDWPGIFGVQRTDWRDALNRTFREKPYSEIVLSF